jgi:hypothetical protein
VALLVPSACAPAPVTSALNAMLRRSWVWCLGAAWQLFSGRTQPSVWQRFWRPIRYSGRGAIRRKHRSVSAHSVLWFLAPWVALVQGIRSGHSAMGAVINCRGNRHLTRRINSRPTAAGRPFHCGCASITRAPLCAGVKCLAPAFFGLVYERGLAVVLGQNTAFGLATVYAANSVFGSRGYPA